MKGAMEVRKLIFVFESHGLDGSRCIDGNHLSLLRIKNNRLLAWTSLVLILQRMYRQDRASANFSSVPAFN